MEEEKKYPNRNKKAVFGWTMYDWANSVYALTITTAIFPSYFSAISKQLKINAEENIHIVDFLGFHVPSISIYSYSISLSYLIIALLSPILGAIADYGGNKKKFMMAFCSIGSLSCALMYFFDKEHYVMGVGLFLLASLGYAGGNIFNDAFLPEVAEPKDYAKISARGYIMGYIGSVIQLFIALALILNYSKLGFSTITDATKVSFVLVGIWWFSFAQVTFMSLKEVKPEHKEEGNILVKGFEELYKVMMIVKANKNLVRFLTGFIFYNMGMQTVIYTATLFGTDELHLKQNQLINTVLLIQFIAIIGATLFAKLSKKLGNINTLLGGITLWTLICCMAYIIKTPMEFYVLACLVGLIMGGVQALSRATYSLFVPETGDNASFFSFYSIADKIAIILGLLSYGWINQVSQNLRTSILFLIVYFVIGGSIIFSLRKQELIKAE